MFMVEDEPSKMDSIKDRLSDIGQKVGDASKKAAKKTSEISSNIAEDIKLGAKKVSEDVKTGAKKVSDSVEKKRDDFKEKREENKRAKAMIDDSREEELRTVLESTELIPISPLDEEEIESDDVEDFEKYTVPQLKSKLSELGLKISGKKSELLERLKESLVKESDDVEEVVEEVSENTDYLETEFIHKSKPSFTWKGRFVIRWLNRTFAITFLLLGIACTGILSEGSIGTLFGLFGELLVTGAERFYSDYGGLSDIEASVLQIVMTLSLIFVGVLFILGCPRMAFLTILSSVSVSIGLRTYFAVENGIWVDVFDYGPMIIDILLAFPLMVTSAVPWLARSDMQSYSDEYESVVNVENPLETTEELYSIEDDEGVDNMDQFAVTRPSRPRRRRPMEFFYEGVFLLISAILWPVTVVTHFLLALEIPTRAGTWSIEENGVTLLAPLYVLSIIASIAVIRHDREARGGPLYAKEKEAYHKFMDQFLSLKEAYYERQAKKLQKDDSE
jgi:hypothetical protein